MTKHILDLINGTAMRSLIDCQITLREIKRIAEVNMLYEELTDNDKVQTQQ